MTAGLKRRLFDSKFGEEQLKNGTRSGAGFMAQIFVGQTGIYLAAASSSPRISLVTVGRKEPQGIIPMQTGVAAKSV